MSNWTKTKNHFGQTEYKHHYARGMQIKWRFNCNRPDDRILIVDDEIVMSSNNLSELKKRGEEILQERLGTWDI